MFMDGHFAGRWFSRGPKLSMTGFRIILTLTASLNVSRREKRFRDLLSAVIQLIVLS